MSLPADIRLPAPEYAGQRFYCSEGVPPFELGQKIDLKGTVRRRMFVAVELWRGIHHWLEWREDADEDACGSAGQSVD